ncbi:beta-ketoacyl synthase [Flavobacterium orientale]|uniref:Beta-ketoacyl synthase n=1 Tax=Flavobacterium orientale TaxID=1756020 RepID=A0A916XWK1_9FLAO|nr:beta-ketoacyl synthase [Flavobacterium orientale]
MYSKTTLLHTKIAITSLASFSPLGQTKSALWKSYLAKESLISEKGIGNTSALVAALPEALTTEVEQLRNSDSKYKFLDASVLYAIVAARAAVAQTDWSATSDFGINIGSSRGATRLFENHHEDFLKTGKVSTLASPTTTLGNISSWVAHDLQSTGPEISHSITCSTALHALLNGVAWLKSGMAHQFLVGGSEAPLTPFTIAQMRAMKIYASELADYPCRTFDFDKTKNTMVLGEGAAVACLEVGEKAKALAYIEGVGYATEVLQHGVSISTDALCFQRSMKMALGTVRPEEIDVIVTHSPGTVKGDVSESNAIKAVFGLKKPLLTNNKWKIGHTFGASGLLSIEMAVLMMQHNHFIQVPFLKHQEQHRPIQKVLVNAVGFGGNAVSVLLSLT